jgi:hypothetical protein
MSNSPVTNRTARAANRTAAPPLRHTPGRAAAVAARRAGTALLLVLASACASGGQGADEAAAPPGTWTAQATAHEWTDHCVPAPGTVVCPAGQAGAVARSADTGKVLWSDVPAGRGGAEVAVDGGRVVVAGGGKLRALGLDDGKTRWTATLPADQRSAPLALTNGVVYVVTSGPTIDDGMLAAYRASDGVRLWQRPTAGASYDLVSMGGRVYTVESGKTAVARDGRTGEIVARSSPTQPCPSLIGGDGRLVCTETAAKAGDMFEPVTLVDPATLQVVRTLMQPLDKPAGGMITDDRLLLHTTNPEDGSLTSSLVVDLDTGATVWEEAGVDRDAVLAGDRVLWVADGRLHSTGLAGGPDARPRTSAKYPEAAGNRHPVLTPHGQHVIVAARAPRTLRSVPLP